MNDVIIITNPPANTPATLLVEGRAYLDFLEEQSPLSVTETLEELTDASKLKGSAVLDFDVPMSERNRHYFAEHLSINNTGTLKQYTCICVQGGDRVLRQNRLVFLGAEDSSGTIKLRLEESEDHWTIAAKNLNINSVDLGEFLFDQASVISNWDDYKYTPDIVGAKGVYFPLAHYGRFWGSENEFRGVTLEDFLPWFHPGYILQKGFAAIGWSFSTPLWDSDWFSRWWAYLLSPDINYPEKGKKWKGEFSKAVDQTISVQASVSLGAAQLTYFHFDTVGDDPSGMHGEQAVGGQGGSYSLFTNTSDIVSDYRISLKAIVSVPGTDSDREFDIAVILKEENSILGGLHRVSVASGETETFELTFDINLGPGQSVFIQPMNFSDPTDNETIVLESGSTIEFLPTSNRLYRFDTVDLASTIHPDYTLFDLFRGIVHLGGLKVDTDAGRRTISVYPPETVTVFGDSVEGFYIDPDTAISKPEIVAGSKKMTVRSREDDRYIRLQFSGPGDERAKKLGFTSDNPLWQKTIDTGQGDDAKTKVLDNPFFEPTANVIYDQMEIPAVWDNADGVRTRNAGPRICLAIGYVYQSYSADPNVSNLRWTFEYATRVKLPYISQYPTRAFRYANEAMQAPSESLVYGDATGTRESLYSLFYQRELLYLLNRKALEFLAILDGIEYESLSFRKKVHIQYDDEASTARLLSKKDHRAGLPTIIEVKTDQVGTE